jgi:hypothetical protein
MKSFFKLFYFPFSLLILFTVPSAAQVWTYTIPGGETRTTSPGGQDTLRSTDYTVSIEQNGEIFTPWVQYSYSRDKYYRHDRDEWHSGVRGGTSSHSSAHFSFDGTITVKVTVNPGAKDITLPLSSAKILPSSYNIPCHIENGNTIVFTLDRPEKVAVIANYDEAWKVFEDRAIGHVPVQSHLNRAGYDRADFHGRQIFDAITEGYLNPLFIMALPPEENIPDRNSNETLVVNPGDKPSQAQLYQYKTIWFAPGMHDFSYHGTHPNYRTIVNPGQTYYLEGGAYLMATLFKNPGTAHSKVTGRGMISGAKHLWRLSNIIVQNIDTVTGITVIDRAARGIHGARHIEDISMLSAWHGNHNGVQEIDNSTIFNCFFMAHDDNLKLGGNSHAKHIVLWQGHNAHPVMVYEYGGVTHGSPTIVEMTTWSNTLVEDLDILMYSADAERRGDWHRHSGSAISINLGRINMQINDFTFRNIRIESPFLYRVFTIYNIDSSKPYAASWFKTNFFYTSPENHTQINGLNLENISVNSPLIFYHSLLGSDYYNSLSNVTFTNLNINGTIVTDQNKEEFFELTHDKISGLSFHSGNVSVSPVASASGFFSVYPVPANDFISVKRLQMTEGRQNYQITDIHGKIVKSGEISTDDELLDLANLPCGIYFLKITHNASRNEIFKILKI